MTKPDSGKPKRTKTQYYQVDRREIAFIKFIFEAYDGIAVLRTVDPSKGIIMLHIAPDCERQVGKILLDLKKNILIRPLASIPSEHG